MKHLLLLAALFSITPFAQAETPANFARERLVAWCIVPFDAKKRGPEERAVMLNELGLTRCAYDWRQEHVPTFKAEVEAYEKHDIEFTAFWGEHEIAFELFRHHGLRPQIWRTCPSPDAPTQQAKVEAATDALLPLAKRCEHMGSMFGLYNHGGWGGEPENLLAVCRRLREKGAKNSGIVYNFHHAHHRIASFEEDLKVMGGFLLCVNLNGMNDGAQPKILPIGQGQHEAAMIDTLIASGYEGPIGILDHLSDVDSKVALQRNLDGLEKLLAARTKPFPENRVQGWYREQAERYLASDARLPTILPAFPGLDGGAWGHWGQNPEADNFDHRLNEVDLGAVVSGYVSHFGKKTPKGVVFAAADLTVLLDPVAGRTVASWRSPNLGQQVRWEARRYGITTNLVPAGKQEPLWDRRVPEGSKYLGYRRDGWEAVAFRFRDPDGKEHWIDSMNNDAPPPGASPQWADKTVTTRGALGDDSGAFAIDTLSVPYRDANPFKTPMRLGGVDVLPDGRIAVGTLMGDVWLVSGADGDLDELVWQRHAAGLHQVLGLVVQDGKVLALGRDQITRLHDTNNDGEADYYECATNEYPTEGGNNFALTLHQDDAGALYWFTRSAKFGMSKWTPGGKPESIATGLRGTNGTGVSPDGKIVFATVQEGAWTPATAIFEVGRGSYHGFFGPKEGHGKYSYDLPMCFIPRGVDNSSGDLVFLPEDERLGPLSGQIVGTSFGNCSHYLVLREELPPGGHASPRAAPAPGGHVSPRAARSPGGHASPRAAQSQGGVVPLPGEFLSGAHRIRFNPNDGHIYVAGSDGWQSYAQEDGSLQRLRWTGKPMLLPTAVETRANGLLITLNAPVTETGKAFAAQWNYLYGPAYGSGEYSAKQPGTLGRDPVEVRSVQLLDDGRKLFVEMPQLGPVMQLHVYVDLPGGPLDLYYTVKELGEPFTEFDGYTAIEKQPLPDFPVAGKVPIDPRLDRQEKLGKHLGDIQSATVRAVAGLKFEPARLTLKSGMRTALTLVNDDPSMPHNFVLVRDPAALERVGQASMQLAAKPEGVAKHYTIDDPDVLALAPVLQPGSSYTIYLDTPKEPGEYPYLCTFPGHWQVTRGVLVIE